MPPSMPPAIRSHERLLHTVQGSNKNNANNEYNENNNGNGDINADNNNDNNNIVNSNINNNNNNNNDNHSDNNNNMNNNSSSFTTFNTNTNLNSTNNLNSSQNFSLNSQIFSDFNNSQQTLSYSENENFLNDVKSNLSTQTLQSLLENEISDFHSVENPISSNFTQRIPTSSASTNAIYDDSSFENSKIISNNQNMKKYNEQKNILKSYRPVVLSHNHEISNYKVSKIRNKTRSREARTGLQKTAYFNTPNDRFMESSL